MSGQRIKLCFEVNDKEFEDKIMYRVKQSIRRIAVNNDCINTGSTGLIGRVCTMYFLVPTNRLRNFLRKIKIPIHFQHEDWVRVQNNTLSYYICCETPTYSFEKKIRRYSIRVYYSAY